MYCGCIEWRWRCRWRRRWPPSTACGISFITWPFYAFGYWPLKVYSTEVVRLVIVWLCASVHASVCESIFTPLNLPDAWTYFYETHQKYLVPGPGDRDDTFKVTGSRSTSCSNGCRNFVSSIGCKPLKGFWTRTQTLPTLRPWTDYISRSQVKRSRSQTAYFKKHIPCGHILIYNSPSNTTWNPSVTVTVEQYHFVIIAVIKISRAHDFLHKFWKTAQLPYILAYETSCV